MGNLRIIGGEKRGFPLASPKGKRLRPTSNRVREALFDIIGDKIDGCRFMDLFAGSGAVGIEALSRGASTSLFAEGDPLNLRVIRENLRACGVESSAAIIPGRLPSSLSRLEGSQPFDLVFVDPPYDTGIGVLVLGELATGKLLRKGAWVIFEHRKTSQLPARCGDLRHRRTARYGDTGLSFFEICRE